MAIFRILRIVRSLSRTRAKPTYRPFSPKLGPHNTATYQMAKVRKVIDGDTIIVVRARREICVRLDAIDCPERGQPWGDTAKYGLVKIIGGREIYMEEHGVDRHGRTVATLYVEDRDTPNLTNVNERMVTLGHAWVMRHFCDHLPDERKAQLNRLERWARMKKVGLWKTADPVPPWKWRRGPG